MAFSIAIYCIKHIVKVELISKCMCKVQWTIFRPFFASITWEIIFNQREAIYRKAFWHLSCLDSMLLLYLNAFKLEIVSKRRSMNDACFLKLNQNTKVWYFILLHFLIHENAFWLLQKIKNAPFLSQKYYYDKWQYTYLLEGILTSVTPP